MSERDELTKVVIDADNEAGKEAVYVDDWAERIADAILAAGFRKPRDEEGHAMWCRGSHEGLCQRGRLTGTERTK